jgi:hypothetical protein
MFPIQMAWLVGCHLKASFIVGRKNKLTLNKFLPIRAFFQVLFQIVRGLLACKIGLGSLEAPVPMDRPLD